MSHTNRLEVSRHPTSQPPVSATRAVASWGRPPERARAVRHDFALTQRNAWAVVELCRRLKEIGAAARAEIGQHLGRPVHLFLHVKVNPRWDEDRGLYREIGLEWAD